VIARLRHEERGIALVLALAISVALSLMVFSMTEYVTSNQRSAKTSSSDAVARGYAEAALDTAYSRINYANTQASISAGLSPSKPTLLGCGTGTSGASDCSSLSPLCVAFTGSCPTSGTYSPTAGTASVYGFFTGTAPPANSTFSGVPEVASMWILVATGYTTNASGKLDAKTLRGTVTIGPGGVGAVAAVWNHVFMTAPLVPGVCQANFGGNNMIIDVPLYVIGNMCLSGQNTVMKEQPGGQPIDLQVGGALSLSGSGTSVGDWTTNPVTGITSGAVVGGCTNGAITTATTTCNSTNYHYSVKNQGAFVPTSDPEETDADIANDYATFDPGPKHPCVVQSGSLASSAFDFAPAANGTGEPNLSGSGSSGGAFELAPSGSDYTCISQSAGGASTGQLSWNHTTHVLTINGSIFFDSNLTISSNVTYAGTAVIEVAGTITFNGNNLSVCAQNTSCSFTNWQGSSGHNDMLTLVSIKKNASPAIKFQDNSQTFQGSLFSQPSSNITFVKNGDHTQGPMAVGSFDATFNNATIDPLPVIKNMPLGAPIPPNVSASISPLSVIG
jgi:Tfp pilus assembly protein PilX